MRRQIRLYELCSWDGADGRANSSTGIITADTNVAEAWKRRTNGNSTREMNGILITSLDEIASVQSDVERARALCKLTARERELLGLKGPELRIRATDGEKLLAETQAAAFRRCEEIIGRNADHYGDRAGDKVRFPHLLKMCRAGAENAGTWPADKTGRWLGHVQGCLASRGLLDVDVERDLTREDFKAAYALMGVVPLATIELDADGAEG